MLITAACSVVFVIVLMIFFGYFNTGGREEAKASGTETITAGSFLVNMGVTPLTFAKGLLP